MRSEMCYRKANARSLERAVRSFTPLPHRTIAGFEPLKRYLLRAFNLVKTPDARRKQHQKVSITSKTYILILEKYRF